MILLDMTFPAKRKIKFIKIEIDMYLVQHASFISYGQSMGLISL